ncbi:hypothetical protein [Coleofasciculus sp. G2-EDA-02]
MNPLYYLYTSETVGKGDKGDKAIVNSVGIVTRSHNEYQKG